MATKTAQELAELFKVMAHADRIRLVAELKAGEKDVTTLSRSLELPPPRVSQHLRLLKAYDVVGERRDGRRRIYRAMNTVAIAWLGEGSTLAELR